MDFVCCPALKLPDGCSCSDERPLGRLEFSLPQPSCRGGAAVTQPPLDAVSRRHLPRLLFARAASWEASDAEFMRVHKIIGDGKCMFRAMAVGMARNSARHLSGAEEERDAEGLRIACYKEMCDRQPGQVRKKYPDAFEQMMIDSNYKVSNYCYKMRNPAYWGSDIELRVLSELLKIPIVVYYSNAERGEGKGYSRVMAFGEQYAKRQKDGKPGRIPVRLLFTGGNHWDLLIK